jgi:hypothetical protein
MVGLNSFLPKRHNPKPTVIKRAPHRPLYVSRKVHKALIEVTEQPYDDYITTFFEQLFSRS